MKLNMDLEQTRRFLKLLVGDGPHPKHCGRVGYANAGEGLSGQRGQVAHQAAWGHPDIL